MRRRFFWEIYIHLILLGIANIRLSSCQCSDDPPKLIDNGLVSTEGFLYKLDRNERCKWEIDVPNDGREYRFVGLLSRGKCGRNRLSVKVNEKYICNSEEIRNMTSDCLASPTIIIDYKNDKRGDKRGFSLTYHIEQCNGDETTKPIKTTPETHVLEEGDITTTTASNSKSHALIEVFVPILVLLSAAIIGLVIYIKCRRKENEDKDSISTQMTDLTTVASQNTAQDAPGFINEGFYASIDERVQSRTAHSAAQEPIRDQGNRKYYEIAEIASSNLHPQNGMIVHTPMSQNDESASGSESTVVANILYGSS